MLGLVIIKVVGNLKKSFNGIYYKTKMLLIISVGRAHIHKIIWFFFVSIMVDFS